MFRRPWSGVASIVSLGVLATAGMAVIGNPDDSSSSTAAVVDGIPEILGREMAASPGDQVIAPPPDDFGDAPVTVEAPPQALNEFAGVVPAGGTWSVVIGVNDYPGGRHDLNSAVADARDVDQALAMSGIGGDRRLVITDRQASGATIRQAARWLVAHSGPDATAVFFFAGHVRKLGSGTEAMVGADGDVVSDGELAQLLGPLQARRAWIAIAACYGGGFTEVLAPGRILTGAAPANSLAYENSAFGRSYMVEYMVRRAMIERQAPESVESAFAWARAALSRDHPNRLPVQYDQADGELRLNAELPPPAPAPPSGDSSSSGGSTGGSTGGSGSAPPPSDGESSPPPEEKDECAKLTLGVVKC